MNWYLRVSVFLPKGSFICVRGASNKGGRLTRETREATLHLKDLGHGAHPQQGCRPMDRLRIACHCTACMNA